MKHRMKCNKNAIALLITVMFVIVITVAIGFGLQQVNKAAQIVKDESFLYQTSIIVEDILKILKTSPDIARAGDANASEELFTLLSLPPMPFESSGVEIMLTFHSARAKFVPASLDSKKIEALKEYISNKMINIQYIDILLDSVGGIRADNSYRSAIFNENPYLFRDYIASAQHLEQINDFYQREYNDNSLKNIQFENLFYFSADKNTSIDLNYATSEVWELMLNTTKERAEYLVQNAGAYESEESLNLTSEELENLKRFATSFFEPILLVDIEIKQNRSSAHISFEYDINSKKESNFVYEI